INVDDTGARHQGHNGYCTHIGNELFAWFESTDSKSRINFLRLLRGEYGDYVINSDALDYMDANKLPKEQLAKLRSLGDMSFENEEKWKEKLQALDITKERHIRIATEGALLGSVLKHGFNKDMVIMSDDAGQFNVFMHALCWVHTERTINKLVGFNDKQRKALEETRSKIWELYTDLKDYKKSPNEEKKKLIEERFDEICTTKTCFVSLNQALKRIYANKSELLLVLERPEIPLHNNLSENDIRDYVKKRKISGSTRSSQGRRCRDTFASLKKTSRKLQVSFWAFLNDRVGHKKIIPWLPDLIRAKALGIQHVI
ncbi:transposase, partial [bacterium]|nr:transposase [bacterium]